MGSPTIFNHELISHKLKESVGRFRQRQSQHGHCCETQSQKAPEHNRDLGMDSNVQHPHVTQSCVVEKTGENLTVSNTDSQYPFTITIFRRSPKIPERPRFDLKSSHS